MYGKIEDNALTIAPNGQTEGFYKVNLSVPPLPVEGGYWEPTWTVENDEIYQTWEWIDFDREPNPTAEELLSILTGGSE